MQDAQLMSLLLHFSDFATADIAYRWWQDQPPGSAPVVEASSVPAVRDQINQIIAASQRDLHERHREQQAQHGLL